MIIIYIVYLSKNSKMKFMLTFIGFIWLDDIYVFLIYNKLDM